MKAKTIKKKESSKEFKISMKAFVENKDKTCRMVDLAARGPVHILKSSQGKGLLVHHEGGSDSIILQSLSTGQRFMLSKEATRELAKFLAEWAGPDESATVSEWVSDKDTWGLAK